MIPIVSQTSKITLLSFLSSDKLAFKIQGFLPLKKLDLSLKPKIKVAAALEVDKHSVFVFKSPKMSHFIPPIFVLLEQTCLVTLSDRKLQFTKNLQNFLVFLINFCPLKARAKVFKKA